MHEGTPIVKRSRILKVNNAFEFYSMEEDDILTISMLISQTLSTVCKTWEDIRKSNLKDNF